MTWLLVLEVLGEIVGAGLDVTDAVKKYKGDPGEWNILEFYLDKTLFYYSTIHLPAGRTEFSNGFPGGRMKPEEYTETPILGTKLFNDSDGLPVFADGYGGSYALEEYMELLNVDDPIYILFDGFLEANSDGNPFDIDALINDIQNDPLTDTINMSSSEGVDYSAAAGAVNSGTTGSGSGTGSRPLTKTEKRTLEMFRKGCMNYAEHGSKLEDELYEQNVEWEENGYTDGTSTITDSCGNFLPSAFDPPQLPASDSGSCSCNTTTNTTTTGNGSTTTNTGDFSTGGSDADIVAGNIDGGVNGKPNDFTVSDPTGSGDGLQGTITGGLIIPPADTKP